MRECFVARPGHVFVDADYSGFELHTWAQSCIDLLGRSSMAEALNSGLDPHELVANQLGARKGEPGFYDARQVGKVGNFGFPGGLGVKGFMAFALSGYGMHLTKDQCQQTRQAWFRQWPESQEYLATIQRAIEITGSITIKRSGRQRGRVTFCQACNTLFQGLAADAAKAAGWELMKAGLPIVNFIHDEFLIEVPEEFGHEAAMLTEEIMVREANKWTPDVPNKVEALLCRRWSKEAKRIVKDGRLQVFE